jgi:HK97 family phage prohead protease
MPTQQLSFPLEIKSIGPKEFTGYGSVFGNEDHGGDIVVKGAFSATLAAHRKAGTMPLMFWMHQPDQVPGVWTEMKEDDRGLQVKGEIVDTLLGRDVRVLLEKKAVRGLSIGFRPVVVDWHQDRRLLKQIDLFETSIVSMAMNPLAKVEAMKARLSAKGEYVPTEREIEALLRDFGCSRTVARTLCAKMFDGDDSASGMLADDQWDAGKAEDDTQQKELAEVTYRLLDVVGAMALKRI